MASEYRRDQGGLERVQEGFLAGQTDFVVPLDLTECKTYLRVTSNASDAEITMLMRSACEVAERLTGRTIMGKNLTLRLDGFPGGSTPWWDGVREGIESSFPCRELKLPRFPVSAVNSVKTYSYAGVLNTFDPSNYAVDIYDKDQSPRVILNVGAVWPTDLRPFMSVAVNYDAGYVDASLANSLPTGLKISILKLLNWLNNNRGDLVPEDAAEKAGAMPSLQNYKIAHL